MSALDNMKPVLEDEKALKADDKDAKTHHMLIPRPYKPNSRFNPKRYSKTGLKTAETWLEGK